MAVVDDLFAVWLLPKSGTRRRHTCSGGMDRPRYMKNTFVSQQKTVVKNRLTIYQMTNCNADPSQRTTCDLEWRDGGSGGPRSFPRPQGPSPTGRHHSSPHLQPPPPRHSHSNPSPPDQYHQVTETVITLLPSHLGASSPARRAFFHLLSDDAGERSGSNQSLSDGRDTAGGAAGELPRLTAQSHGSADSNAKHSSGVFILPTDHLRIDSPRFRDNRERLGGGGRGSQWSPISKDSFDNARESGIAAKLGPQSNIEPTSSRLLQSDYQDPETETGRGPWTTRQRTVKKSELRPSQGNTLRDGYTQERTFIGVTKVNPLTRMNQILSKSNTNLSRSDLVLEAGRRGNNTSNLQRYCSEINLVNRFTGYEGNRGPQHLPNTSAQRPAALTTQPNRKTLMKSQSQPLFRPGNDRQRPPANRKSYPVVKNDSKDTPESEEEAKQERIIEWLLDIDGYADPPDSPIIFEDGPLQSDTAIHVVYEGD